MSNFYTKQQYENAQRQSLISHLEYMGMSFEKSNSWYRSKEHSSLVINENNQWHWNSKGLHGNRPVELVKQLLINQGYSEKDAFIKAIQDLGGTDYSANSSFSYNYGDKNSYLKKKEDFSKELDIPNPKGFNNRAIAYLVKTRGIDYEIVKDMIIKGKIYETEKYGNVAFVSSNKIGEPKHIFLRGSITSVEGKSFKKDMSGSDKSYPFVMEGHKNSEYVMVFESAIDVLSHATIHKKQNRDISATHRIALHGISTAGLDRFLQSNPKVKYIIPCMDNDEAGRRANEKITKEFEEKGYIVKKPHVPKDVKDVNEALLKFLKYNFQTNRQKDYEMER
ncbi:MAG: DUF3991 and toprim domain-containing protein [Defluviitaleaceae bacterium]|nr:DUF3991 and toprim domain-containing protein [Defluviitaleaceae bacterium]